MTENDYIAQLDHPPSPQELAEIYLRAEENDPRSVFYKRVLVRPKVPVGELVLIIVFVAASATAAGLGVAYLADRWWLTLIAVVAAAALVGLIFAKRLLIALVKTYQALASEDVRKRCRYEPSCSVYMLQAVEKYGFWRGLRKGLRRWKGCKPPNGGIDLP